ncbi:Golgin candidate 6 [Heracleum sosnowskyi]|uniref:Golgin candidate 6 n=1 Tax=Heracleum sosnowskyi TaxID=360622 RepID=A0AAD8M679_9APIA|nr:Golgin candidate 6 [Heracleum sosnowskyi]
MLFSGNLVQFFCSLAAHGYASCTSAVCIYEPVACIISDAMPKILAWCLSKQEDRNKTCTSQYLRHKILKLMIRLTYQMHLQCQVLVSWLNIISKYFQDLLAEPLIVDNNLDDSLEGSPFLNSFSKENKGISERHLQRLAVFLFLRCSLNLVCQRDGVDEHCICANINPRLLSEQKYNHSCCNKKQGLLGLYQWLRGHFTRDIFVDNEIYIQNCASFSLSFLRLYMHEDDILFKVLLQLFTIPLSVKPVCEGSKTPQTVEDEESMLRLISNLLNPICLFHLFLAELLYDHQVLLDYLMSKDTGASSAEYLLRCLRAVRDSWTFFVEFSWDEEVKNNRYSKKRKVFVDVHDFEGGEISVPRENDDSTLSLPKRCMTDDVDSSRQHRTRRLSFEDAMECLLSLKNALLNLHRKKLFPYNPDVLLRRLTKFEELCFKQKKT